MTGENRPVYQPLVPNVGANIPLAFQRTGFLKVSLEEVLIALRDDAHFLDDLDGLLSGQYRERTAEHATLYPHGFSASRFLEVIDSEEVWKERKVSESPLH